VNLIRNVQLAWRLFWDRRVPVWAKSVPVLSLAYVVLPMDFAPDWILGLGQMDDLAILFLGVRAFIALCPPALVASHRKDIRDNRPANAGEGDVVDGSYEYLDDEDVEGRDLPEAKRR
jgi:uncharacterized membrane protein YkvA (DUF1232 family)